MEKSVIYAGEFVSVAGAVWRAEIWRDTELQVTAAGELTFDGDDPVVIERQRRDKHEPLCGSSATLKVISPGDRTYIDLYTVAAGTVGLNLYRDGALHWSGTLDPEFYEEPYEQSSGYEVSLTFSDFGILDRLKWSLSGLVTLQQIIADALGRARLDALEVDAGKYISTYFPENPNKVLPAYIGINSENFIDEEGEAMTLKEVLTGMLQPLALRMEQRSGKIWVYDLNGLHSEGERREICWSSDSQTLGVDKTLNNVKVTFSPYAGGELLGSVEYGGNSTASLCNLSPRSISETLDIYKAKVASGDYRPMSESFVKDSIERLTPVADRYGEFYSFYTNLGYEDSWRWMLIGEPAPDTGNIKIYPDFSIFLSTEGKGLGYINPAWCRYFHITPLLSGSAEAEGVCAGLCTSIYKLSSYNRFDYPYYEAFRRYFLKDISIGSSGRVVLKSKRVYLPALVTISGGNMSMRDPITDTGGHLIPEYYLRLSLETLIDPRYNPFASDGDLDNDTDSYNEFKKYAGWVFLPIAVNIYDDDGKAICHYTNSDIARTSAWGHLEWAQGRWDAGEGAVGDAWLEYYDVEDPEEGNGILGWKTNRHCIGRADKGPGRENSRYYPDGGKVGERSEAFKKMPAGEYIPYPDRGGWLEVTVYEGIRAFAYSTSPAGKEDVIKEYHAKFDAPHRWSRQGLLKKLRWYLLKAPQVEIVKGDRALERADIDDVEYTGWINPDAKDGEDIDTICGSLPDSEAISAPHARGIYTTGAQVRTLTRAGVTDHPENLLIGTLYSQYADRHAVLSGEAALDPGGLAVYTDAAQPDGKVFIKTSSVEYCRTDTDDAEFTELSPDNYEPIKPVE